MRLIEMKLRKYGRFEEASIYTDGKMTSIIGANESGKTTILAALRDLNLDGKWIKPFIVNAYEGEDKYIISYRFALDSVEISDFASYEIKPAYFIIEKFYDGGLSWDYLPAPVYKADADGNLGKIITNMIKKNQLDSLNSEVDKAIIDKFVKYLESDGLASSSDLEKASQSLLDAIDGLEEANEATDNLKAIIFNEIDSRAQNDLLYNKVGEKLFNERPKFLLYSEEIRNLPWRASIEEEDEIKRLEYIFRVGGTSVAEITSLLGMDLSKLNNRLRIVSKQITKTIMNRWKQSDLEIELRAEGAGIINFEIFDSGSGMSHPIERRSEGLRQFIALSSFLRSMDLTSKPVILVDEIEQHLHLQAQAELVDFFEKQTFASQVIYSTHSPGALPQDLNNVRAVITKPDGTSEIKNRPWQERGNQVERLFNLLGSAAFIFAALRAAVVTEGNVDAMVYPILFKEASALSFDKPLGFQCIPGLSRDGRHTTYAEQSIHLVYLVDGDKGGMALRDSLLSQGVQEEQVFSLEEGLCLEDYVDNDVLIRAVNKYLDDIGRSERVKKSDISTDIQKIKHIENKCKSSGLHEIDKKRIAAIVLDMEREGSEILDTSRKEFIRTLFANILHKLRLEVT
ncbi:MULTISPECIES: AAA family ATPase [Deinococcus]|uniref:AAA family ATPase n=1 Tax=Deinococcus rufus TaxID=2136097 RepID=A0ABV7Z982_9DEIO|nr:AAA family ATPase [Deinococcus sp. AB2017081]WQE96148.1 AAA family ATPase [Deinococcus sp. AB2017081]